MAIQATDNIYPLYKRQNPEEWTVDGGMTKREHFSILVLQGLVSHYGYELSSSDKATQELAHWAVKLTDVYSWAHFENFALSSMSTVAVPVMLLEISEGHLQTLIKPFSSIQKMHLRTIIAEYSALN
jgi:hypothetical protein